jgi:hypothetical protein
MGSGVVVFFSRWIRASIIVMVRNARCKPGAPKDDPALPAWILRYLVSHVLGHIIFFFPFYRPSSSSPGIAYQLPIVSWPFSLRRRSLVPRRRSYSQTPLPFTGPRRSPTSSPPDPVIPPALSFTGTVTPRRRTTSRCRRHRSPAPAPFTGTAIVHRRRPCSPAPPSSTGAALVRRRRPCSLMLPFPTPTSAVP